MAARKSTVGQFDWFFYRVRLAFYLKRTIIFRWSFYRDLPSNFTTVVIAPLSIKRCWNYGLNILPNYKHLPLLWDTPHTLGFAKITSSFVSPAFAPFNNIQANYLIHSNISGLVKSILFCFDIMLMTSIWRFLLDGAVLLRLNPYSGRFYFIEKVLRVKLELNILIIFLLPASARANLPQRKKDRSDSFVWE